MEIISKLKQNMKAVYKLLRKYDAETVVYLI
jgi:hypothetical protein